MESECKAQYVWVECKKQGSSKVVVKLRGIMMEVRTETGRLGREGLLEL